MLGSSVCMPAALLAARMHARQAYALAVLFMERQMLMCA